MTPGAKNQADIEPAATLLESNEHPRHVDEADQGDIHDILEIEIGSVGQLHPPLYQEPSASKLVDRERKSKRHCSSMQISQRIEFWAVFLVRISETVQPSESRIVHRACFVHAGLPQEYSRCLIVYHCLQW